MQRRRRAQMEGRVAATGGGAYCRIRKRGCSSTSSSSQVQKGRLKRPILIARRTGLRPLSSSPTARNDELLTHTPSRSDFCNGKKAPKAALSARKLAATLWETNEVPSPRPTSPPPPLEKEYKRRAERMVARSHLEDLSDHSPVSKSMDPARTLTLTRGRRRTSPSSLSLSSQGGARSTTSLVEIQCGVDGGDLTASRALLKVLGHVWGMEEQHTSSMSLVSALRYDLQRARAKIEWLSREHRSAKNEITYLVNHFAKERASWKRRERDRIRDAVSSAAREVEAEGKLRRQAERLNKKLSEDLAEAEAELKRERKAREVLEEVYEEVARVIGEERARAEETEKESARVREEVEREREEVEREREMLQLADVLREERVQMKLSEAKYQFEEKNAAVERMREEVEAYLKAMVGEENGIGSHIFETFHESYAKKTCFVDPRETRGGVEEDSKWQVANEGRQKEHDDNDDNDEDEDDEDYSSSGSDLHSIELNMDNKGRCYEWSYACGNGARARDDPKRRVSVDHDKIKWGDISIGRQVSNYGEEEEEEEEEEEVKRYKSLQTLRDYIMSGASGLEFASQGLANPARE